MSSRQRRRRGNVRQRLQKQLEIQRELERELQYLNSAENPKESCEAIIKHVENNPEDPMASDDNPFKIVNNPCCTLL